MQITTLIPAYKPKYLIDLMTCLRHQTVKPARVIVSDDSPDRAFITALSTEPLKSLLADLNIELIEGPRQGGYNNFRHLFRHFHAHPQRTELFHVLLDDDLIYPSFYARHLQAHAADGVQCAVSRRWTTLENGQPVRDDLPVPDVVLQHPQKLLALEAPMLFAHTAGASKNWLGEFSNTTFRAELAMQFVDIRMAGISYAGLEDLGAFLKASLSGSLAFIADHLGAFRQNAEQNSANPMGRPLKLAFVAYIAIAIAARRMGTLHPQQAQEAVERCAQFVLHHYSNEPDMQALCTVLNPLLRDEKDAEEQFLAEWHKYAGDPTGLTAGEGVSRPLTSSPAISVLMPVYNGATYLGATLDALLKQDFRDFEVLCMDDCSTDGSAEILQAYAERDARVRLIRMPANLGCVPLVINQCKEQIRGDWCVYTSQDDLFSVNWLSSMHARALVTGADAVIPDVVFYYENEPARQSALVGLHGDRNAVLSGRDAVLYSLNWTIPGNALWRSSMVRELGYADFATNADEYTARVFFLRCQKVVFCDGQFLYRQDNPGAITKKITPKTFDLPYTFVQLAKFLLEQGFPIETSRGELHKAMRSLSELKTWLQTSRHLLSSADIADAENRVMRCEAALNESAIQELLTISESAS